MIYAACYLKNNTVELNTEIQAITVSCQFWRKKKISLKKKSRENFKIKIKDCPSQIFMDSVTLVSAIV